MPRKAKSFTLVFLNQGSIDHEPFDDADKLRAKLAAMSEDEIKDVAVFASEPLPVAVSRDPVVTIGKARERKPAKPKTERKPRAPKAAKGTQVAADFFDKPANGTAPTPAPEPEAPPAVTE